jgi:hypothetical protein
VQNIAVSDAVSLAIAARPVASAPASMARAVRSTSSLAASIRLAMSASRNATAWCSMIGRPNWTRVRA